MSATTGDMPQITSSTYGQFTSLPLGASATSSLLFEPALDEGNEVQGWAPERLYAAARQFNQPQPTPATTADPMPTTTRRLVQVFIADTDANVPLESAMLYRGEPIFTDATDQELYFDIPVASLLAGHNEKRKGWLDKDATRKAGKDIFLDPAKIRDLRMVVVTIASF